MIDVGAVIDSNREQMLFEIRQRMESTDEHKRMLEAMDFENQADRALSNWLSYLKRARIGGRS